MKLKRDAFFLCWIICLFAVSGLLLLLTERSNVSVLKTDSCRQEEFRKQKLKPELYDEIAAFSEQKGNFGEILTTTMLMGEFEPEKMWTDNSAFLKYKKEEFYTIQKCYEAVWADVIYFPIPSRDISFENGWMEPREYGGKRYHEGTDLFGKIKQAGYYPVVSMTDGVVEQIGWLPLGGYRIGIRSPHGGYFYYAHFSQYEKDFLKGEEIKAGDILGYMGNTGYGPLGTSGEFPVHLHVGIYLTTSFDQEMSVNPYWVLKAVQKKIIKYTY